MICAKAWQLIEQVWPSKFCWISAILCLQHQIYQVEALKGSNRFNFGLTFPFLSVMHHRPSSWCDPPKCWKFNISGFVRILDHGPASYVKWILAYWLNITEAVPLVFGSDSYR